MKLLHEENYKGFIINIHGRYIEDYYDWTEKDTHAVKLEYLTTTVDNKNFYINGFQYKYVVEKKPYKFLFRTFYPKTTFEEDVREEINYLTEYIKDKIDVYLYEQEMTNGLLESLRK
jgi:hypothetical protein